MDKTIILTVIGKNGLQYELDYSDNYYVVANTAFEAGLDEQGLWLEFQQVKSKLKKEILEELAREDYESSIILRCTNIDGQKFDVTIFDGEEGYILKRKKHYNLNYNDKMIQRDREEYQMLLDEKIKDVIRSKNIKTKKI